MSASPTHFEGILIDFEADSAETIVEKLSSSTTSKVTVSNLTFIGTFFSRELEGFFSSLSANKSLSKLAIHDSTFSYVSIGDFVGELKKTNICDLSFEGIAISNSGATIPNPSFAKIIFALTGVPNVRKLTIPFGDNAGELASILEDLKETAVEEFSTNTNEIPEESKEELEKILAVNRGIALVDRVVAGKEDLFGEAGTSPAPVAASAADVAKQTQLG